MAEGWGAPATNGGDDSWNTSGGGEADACGNGDGDSAASATAAVENLTIDPAEAEARKQQKEADLQKARNAGWTETTAYDYGEFMRTGGNDQDWHGAGKVYEWKDEYGDVAPAHPELEKILFGGEFQMRRGDHYSNIDLEVNVEGPQKIAQVKKFEDAGIHPVVMRNIELARYEFPTPIQKYTIPAVIQGYDVVAIAQTGSGKTAAYMIPILSKLMGKAKKLAAARPDTTADGYNPRLHKVRAEPLVVVVVPTRELAMQIFDEARRMCYRSMLRPCVMYGGLPMGIALEQLGAGCDILIATPGRLCDMMDKPDVLTLSRVKFTVIDEADEMLDQDWQEELKKIMSGGDTNEDADHQYLMFSATFPKGAREMARQYMVEDYMRIRVGRAGQAHRNIRQNVIFVDPFKKSEAVYDLLFEMDPARTIIFCNGKMTVDKLDDYLYNKGLPTTSIHADRNQREREDAMRAFRTGRAPILIATGISARGWDIKDCKHIINYDLPSTMHGGINEYVHRIGRTARIGHQGLATSFYNEKNEDIGQDLVNVLVECDCPVPDFLSHLAPKEGAALNFDDDTDDEVEGGDEANVAFGDNAEGGAAVPPAWGAAPEGGDSGFAPDAGFTADGDAGAAAAW